MLSSSLNGSSELRCVQNCTDRSTNNAAWDRSKEKFYLIFELAAGGELYEHLVEESRFGEEEAREVAHALAVRSLSSSLRGDEETHKLIFE